MAADVDDIIDNHWGGARWRPEVRRPHETAFQWPRHIRYVTSLLNIQAPHGPLIGERARAERCRRPFEQQRYRVRQERIAQPGAQDEHHPQTSRDPPEEVSASGASIPTFRKVIATTVPAGGPSSPAWSTTP